MQKASERPTAPLFLASFGALTSFYLLLPVAPYYTYLASNSNFAAGVTNGTLMAAAVASGLVMSRALARFGSRLCLAMGLALLGLPPLILLAEPSIPFIIFGSAVRGVGLAAVTVTGGAWIAGLAGAATLDKTIARYGLSVGLPAVVGLPVGIWLAPHTGYSLVFVVAALAALAPLLAIRRVPELNSRDAEVRFSGIPTKAVIPSCFLLATVAFGAGAISSFLPLIATDNSKYFTPVALLVQAIATVAARWATANFFASAYQLKLAVAAFAAASGTAILGVTEPASLTALFCAMVLFGLGFGTTQSITLIRLVKTAEWPSYNILNATWNLAFDIGLGAGAVAFGAAAEFVGYSIPFLTISALVLTAWAIATHDR